MYRDCGTVADEDGADRANAAIMALLTTRNIINVANLISNAASKHEPSAGVK